MRFSALQRAEIAEMKIEPIPHQELEDCFSALQRAEIAEIDRVCYYIDRSGVRFSALQRAEIAEIQERTALESRGSLPFQCSSTSRNC